MIPSNAWTLRITGGAGTELAVLIPQGPSLFLVKGSLPLNGFLPGGVLASGVSPLLVGIFSPIGGLPGRDSGAGGFQFPRGGLYNCSSGNPFNRVLRFWEFLLTPASWVLGKRIFGG